MVFSEFIDKYIGESGDGFDLSPSQSLAAKTVTNWLLKKKIDSLDPEKQDLELYDEILETVPKKNKEYFGICLQIIFDYLSSQNDSESIPEELEQDSGSCDVNEKVEISDLVGNRVSFSDTKTVLSAVSRLRRKVAKVKNVVLDEEFSSVIDTMEFDGPVANVGYNIRVTQPLGNYTNVQIGVSLQIPCYIDEIQDAKVFAKDFCEEEVENQLGKFCDAKRIMITRETEDGGSAIKDDTSDKGVEYVDAQTTEPLNEEKKPEEEEEEVIEDDSVDGTVEWEIKDDIDLSKFGI